MEKSLPARCMTRSELICFVADNFLRLAESSSKKAGSSGCRILNREGVLRVQPTRRGAEIGCREL